jgi:hypothetical protein
MDNKYPKHVIDYAIDNKVSLEEAYRHYIMHGKEEKKEEVAPEINIEEEEKFLSELEEKIKNQLSEDVMNDQEWWNKWHQKMEKIEEMEKELGVERDDIITKEEYNWVEAELEQVDKLYNEMYPEDV